MQLSPTTQTTLLLCAPFVAAKQKDSEPLSPGEFNELEQRIVQRGFELEQLLDSRKAPELFEALTGIVEIPRLETLLGRGFMLSLCMERWTQAGLWIVGRSDDGYPTRFKARLKQHAPAVLHGCGELSLLNRGGVAIVGSRDVDEAGTVFTQRLGASCAREKLQVISGGARGVDQIAMLASLELNGTVAGVMADSLLRSAVSAKVRDAIRDSHLTLVSPFDPDAGFNVGNAMNRNKLIYALADHGVVVSSGMNEGGSWAGAVEQLEKLQFVPLLVRDGANVPEGNKQLIKRRAIAFPESPWPECLKEELQRLESTRPRKMETADLFAGM